MRTAFLKERLLPHVVSDRMEHSPPKRSFSPWMLSELPKRVAPKMLSEQPSRPKDRRLRDDPKDT